MLRETLVPSSVKIMPAELAAAQWVARRPQSVLEFISDDAAAYAQVRVKLERAGTPIGRLDTLIAAQAMARKLVLVSNNQREFGRVAGLHIQNWTS
jgi:tRNA(fMet)-specific endonuclease VapC